MKLINDYLKKLGFLRSMLVAMAGITILFKSHNGEPAILEGIGLITTVIIPVIAPLILMLLILDILMTNVLKSDTEGEARARYNMIIKINVLTCVALLVFWVPFFMTLGG